MRLWALMWDRLQDWKEFDTSSRMYWGIWVDFPLPVAPCTTTTLLCCRDCRKAVRRSWAGSPARTARMRASELLVWHAFHLSCTGMPAVWAMLCFNEPSSTDNVKRVSLA